VNRRRFLTAVSLASASGAAFARSLAAQAQQGLTKETIAQAEKLAGLEFSDAERQLMLEELQDNLEAYAKLRAVAVPNSVPPAFRFTPPLPGSASGAAIDPGPRPLPYAPSARAPERPASDDELAFLPVTDLAALVAARRLSSVELTELTLARLERYGPGLECVVTSTRERALEQARRADRELAAGRYRGPLHGIPWGAKDLLSVAGYRTTWGSVPFQEQRIEEDSTVVRRLDEAGAVLVAKTSVGELAWGDVWFGGRTRNPWNPEEGSSGSSAGSAAATAAGLLPFAIGTETLGSIVSPCTRCGATGLRPTFGRVSRHGAMALCWTMDKVGPIARSVADCALVFDVIRGADGIDETAVDQPFSWPPPDVRRLRVGFLQTLFERPAEGPGAAAREEWRRLDLAVLDVLRGLGVELVPLELPSDLPIDALAFVLGAEAAAAFDELTRSGQDDLLVRQVAQAWPNVLRAGRMVPAVEYIQANRVRTLAIRALEEKLRDLDAYVSPTYGGSNLLLTNLTGHPTVVVPNGFRANGTPTSITFVGRLWGETAALGLAQAYQQATDFHLRRPDLGRLRAP
jgi:Asp-tRNA(Asn)/Glu-tRNA(Gln) amidotransferase A subunit family amidase